MINIFIDYYFNLYYNNICLYLFLISLLCSHVNVLPPWLIHFNHFTADILWCPSSEWSTASTSDAGAAAGVWVDVLAALLARCWKISFRLHSVNRFSVVWVADAISCYVFWKTRSGQTRLGPTTKQACLRCLHWVKVVVVLTFDDVELQLWR